MKLKPVLMATSAVLMACSAPAFATNGYFSHGYSIAQRALGGAGTALPEDALIASINPAGGVWVGKRFDMSVGWFAPIRGYSATDVGSGSNMGIFSIEPTSESQISRNQGYIIPAMAFTRPINDTMSWGIAMYGNGGMNSEYDSNFARFGRGIPGFATQCNGSFGGGGTVNGAADAMGFCGNKSHVASVDLIQMFIVPNFSMKIGEKSSIGIAPLLAGQRFKASGLGAFAKFSNAPDQITENGNDYSFGYGGRVGFITGLIPRVGIGGSYQTRISMSRFEKYQGLFAEQGKFDIPSTWNLGASFQVTPNQRLVYDYQRINFNEVKSVGNSFNAQDFVDNCAVPRLFGDTTESPSCMGSATGPGFGWSNVSVHKLGYQVKFAAFKFRVGASQNNQPIASDQVLFNVLAPAVPERHYTAGVSWQYNKSVGFDFSTMYAQSHAVRGKNPLSNVNATVDLTGNLIGFNNAGPDDNDQDIEINMHQWEAFLGMHFNFD